MKICTKCVLPETYPGIKFDENGVCNYCSEYALKDKKNIKTQFQSEEELVACLEKYRNPQSKYDVLVPVSGGVDSSVVLINMVEKYGLRPLAFHNDHGYEDETATSNVRKLCAAKNVDLVLLQHDFEFMKKMWKHLNASEINGMSACYICGNILYLNALEVANQYNIRLIVNGYSKGQAAIIDDNNKGSKLMEELLDRIGKSGDRQFFNDFTGKYGILGKQKIFKTKADLEAEVDSEKILVLPFYAFKFHKTDKEVLRSECIRCFDWKPMKLTYPKRTTNCEMIWLNSFMDIKKMNYSVYHDEYSGLIRAGEITREQALEDLNFNPPDGLIERLAKEIGLDLNAKQQDKQNESKQENLNIEFDF